MSRLGVHIVILCVVIDFVAVQSSAVQNASNGKHLSSNKWLKNIVEIPNLQNQREWTPSLDKIIAVLLARKQNEAKKSYIRNGDSMNDFMYKLNTFIKKHTKNNTPGKRDACTGFGKFGSHIYRSCKKSLFKGPLVLPDADFRRNQYQQHMFVERARSDSSSESDWSEDRGRSKSSRFKIVNNGKKQKINSETESEPVYSDEDIFKESDDSDYTYKKKSPKKKTKNVKAPSESEEDEMDNQFMYLQGSRLHSPRRTRRDDTRDRLPHFLPKKYHWFPEAIHKLDSFWLNGDISKKDLYFEY